MSESEVPPRDHLVRGAEEALRESEERFRCAFTDSGIGMAIVSLDGRWLQVNRALCEITGYSEAELLATDFQNITHPGDLEADLAFYRRTLTGELDHYRMEKRYLHKLGRVVWIQLDVSLVRDDQGRPLTFVSQIQDITARKSAEAALVESEARYRLLARELQTARETERTRIAREIHDELGQTLTALRLEVAWLSRSLGRGNPAKEQRLKSILQLLDSTTDSVQRIATDLRPSVLDELGLRAAIEWQALEFQNHCGVQCEVRVPSQEVQLDGDQATVVFRVLQEALTNVARHAAAGRVTVRLDIIDGQAVLEVHDDGRGITTPDIMSSHSLGLVGMRERALGLGGAVEIATGPGDGTTLTLSIPITADPMEPAG